MRTLCSITFLFFLLFSIEANALTTVELKAPSATNYQWYRLDGGANQPVVGETQQTFLATQPGIYHAKYGNGVLDAATIYFMATCDDCEDTTVKLSIDPCLASIQWYEQVGSSYNPISGANGFNFETTATASLTTYFAAISNGSGIDTSGTIAVMRMMSVEDCSNGIDDDGDGAIDCEDFEDCPCLPVLLDRCRTESATAGTSLIMIDGGRLANGHIVQYLNVGSLSANDINFNHDMGLRIIDPFGQEVNFISWNFGSSSENLAHAMEIIGNDIYVTGRMGASTTFISKYDSSLNLIWERTFPLGISGVYWGGLNDIQKVNDTLLLTTGERYNGVANRTFNVLIDTDGTVQEVRSPNNALYRTGWEVAPLSDGTYYESNVLVSGSTHYISLEKMTSAGARIWANFFTIAGYPTNDSHVPLILNSQDNSIDSGIVINYNLASTGAALFYKYDETGVPLASNQVTGPAGSIINITGMEHSANGSYIAAGEIQHVSGDHDLLAIGLDANLNVTWMKSYGTTGDDRQFFFHEYKARGLARISTNYYMMMGAVNVDGSTRAVPNLVIDGNGFANGGSGGCFTSGVDVFYSEATPTATSFSASAVSPVTFSLGSSFTSTISPETSTLTCCIEDCSNGIDDDSDGLVDCDDPDCATYMDCLTCDAVGVNASGDTTWNRVDPEPGYNRAIAYRFTGDFTDFVVPAGVTQVFVKAWGAGGGGFLNCSPCGAGTGHSTGGAGGFAQDILTVIPGEAYKVVVGEGGYFAQTASDIIIPGSFGGGGSANTIGSPATEELGSGGGLTGLFANSYTQANARVIAGGGGGASDWGGYHEVGGGNAQIGTSGGYFPLQGESGLNNGRGGGGGGYVGGALGADRQAVLVSGHNTNPALMMGGEGGTGYVTTAFGVLQSTTEFSRSAPNTVDVHYVNGIGNGGTVAAAFQSTPVKAAGDGMLILQWNDPAGALTLGTPIADASITCGDSVTLTTTAGGPTSPTFTWTSYPNGPIISGQGTNSIIVAPVTTTTYYLAVEDTVGSCPFYDTIVVTVTGSCYAENDGFNCSNLVTNGGFESVPSPCGIHAWGAAPNAIPNWTYTNEGGSGGCPVSRLGNGCGLGYFEGTRAVDFQSHSSGFTTGGCHVAAVLNTALNQTITTIPGETYELSFYALRGGANTGQPPTYLGMNVHLNGALFQSISNLPTAWTRFEYTFVATSTSTNIKFINRQNFNVVTALDRVNVSRRLYLSVNGGNNASVNVTCNEPYTIHAQAQGGDGSYTYNWYSVPAGFSASTPSITVVPTEDIQYFVDVTSDGCTVTSSIDLTPVNCPEFCDNGIDDDGDGLVDCDDPDCAPDPACYGCNAFGSSGGTVTWQAVTPQAGYNKAIAYFHTGVDQQFTVPANVDSVQIKTWGAAGGGSRGGNGGFASGFLSTNAGDELKLIVGRGGYEQNWTGGALPATYGGGGGTRNGNGRATGGGRSAIQKDGAEVLTAGGGGGMGGGSCGFRAGHGGGLIGGSAVQVACASYSVAGTSTGGTQSSGGVPGNSIYFTWLRGAPGAQFQGGQGGVGQNNINNAGGGGGGGFYGGAGGNGHYDPGPSGQDDGGGGGGSSYVGGVTSPLTIGGNNSAAGNSGDIHYITGVGRSGSTSIPGGNGMIVIQWYDADLVEICNNDIDDDCDGLIDENDDDCMTPAMMAMNDINVSLEGAPVNGNVLTNDFHTMESTFSIQPSGTVNPANGSLGLNPDGSYVYQPDSGFIGEDQFTYVICDTLTPQNCDTADVVIQVVPGDVIGSNDPPIANNDAYVVAENQIVSGDVVNNDTDPENSDLFVALVDNSNLAGGSLTLNPDGTFDYTPVASYTGPASFTYEACDTNTPAACDTALVTIDVMPDNALNDPPFAGDDASSGVDTLTGDLLPNDSDPENSPLMVNSTPVAGPSNGQLTINSDGSYIYIPNDDFEGTDMFIYEICDTNSPAACAQATVYLMVFPKEVCLSTTVFLEGPFIDNGDTMTTWLNYFCDVLPLAHPYNVEPWNYSGSETVNSMESGVVDWVMVSVRTSTYLDSTKGTMAGLLYTDGQIKAVGGGNLTCFDYTEGDSLYVVVEHRNHMAAMSATPIAQASSDPILVDFRYSESFIVGGGGFSSAGQKMMGTRDGVGGPIYTLFAGDPHKESGGKNDINSNDVSDLLSVIGQFGVYTKGDHNLDCDHNSNDLPFVLNNLAKTSVVE